MRRTRALVLLLLLLTAVVQPAATAGTTARSSACSGGPCINEVIPNPAGLDNATFPGGEWVEIHNEGSTTTDMRGWTLVNEAGMTLTLNATTIVGWNGSNAATYSIVPGGYMVVARNGLSDFWLANTGARSVRLDDATGTARHTVTWTGSASGVSYERDASSPTSDLVATTAPTPGSANDGSATTLFPGPVYISEVMADPWPSFDDDLWPGGEWIEVASNVSTATSLAGWSIVDTAGNTRALSGNATFAASGVLTDEVPAFGRVVVAMNGSAMLNNAGERLDLLWPNGSVAQRLTWGAIEPGFALQDGGEGTMVLAVAPTPFAAEHPLLDDLPRMDADLRFEEVMAMGRDEGGAASTSEWVEVHNAGAAPVDLTGWSIGGGLGNITLLDPSNVSHDGSGSILDADARALVHFTGVHRLWNGTDILRLLDPTGSVRDIAHWTSEPGTDVALVRASDALLPWVTTAVPTPGSNGSAPANAPFVRMTEVLASRSASDATGWVELRNMDDVSVDLDGWFLVAPQRNMSLEASAFSTGTTTLAPGDVAVVDLGGDLLLKHDQEDLLALMSPDLQVVQEVGWSSIPVGESIVPANQSHAGAGPDGLNRGAAPGWDLSAWPTPDEVEPVWPAWTLGAALSMTEAMPECSTGTPSGTWLELHNSAEDVVNASRWRLEDASGRSWFVREDRWWTPNDTGLLLDPDARGLLLLDGAENLDGTVVLHDPDSESSSTYDLSGLTIGDCTSFIDLANPREGPWPTPGYAEPDAAELAGPDDLRFTALLVDGTMDGLNVEFVEIRNVGHLPAVLDGWTLERRSSPSAGFSASFTSLRLEAGDSITLSANASALVGTWDGNVADMTTHLDAAVHLHDDGGALRLLSPDGTVADAVVWGDGPVDIEGWNGVALSPPLAGLERLVYLRGSGCMDLEDSDSANDWRLRWTRIGASTPCVDRHFTDLTNLRPIISPEAGVVDLVRWIDGASTSLDVQVYQIQEPNLVHALLRAAERGVDVRVVMDAGDEWWSASDLRDVDGMSAVMQEAGIEVLLVGAEDTDAYAFMHAKVAVRDGLEVWIGSGNWKSSSAPAPGEEGNRDWALMVESPQLVAALNDLLAMDRDPDSPYVRPATASAPAGWTLPPTRALSGNVATAVGGTASADLLTCPDDCIAGITGLLDAAEDEVLLSLQYLESDWTWGWGDNPLLESMLDAAARGVRLRVALNGAYLDDDVQAVVDLLNEDWNATMGYDVQAVLMSPGDAVTKLHNKGAIVDGEHVLISSINWGDSAMLRNRELGLLVHHSELADVYRAAWNDDWMRLDATTDSDNDGLTDAWEVLHGTNRSRRSAVSPDGTEASLDPDGDGLTHAEEAHYGSLPFDSDTDGDCILDGLEVARAEAMPDGPSATARLTKTDANNDGVEDHVAEGCDNSGPTTNDGDHTNASTAVDVDEDGVDDVIDRCPATPSGDLVDAEGCSADQRRELLAEGENQRDGIGWMLPTVALLGAFVALVGLLGMRREGASVVKDVSMPVALHPDRPTPVLDGREEIKVDLRARLVGWDEAIIDERLSEGWTLEQLVDYYDQQQ